MEQPTLASRIFQWASPFRLENADLSPAELAARINALDRPKDSFLCNNTVTASAVQTSADEHQWVLSLNKLQRGRYAWYNTAELSGTLTYDPARNMTTAEGFIQLGRGAVTHMWVDGLIAIFLAFTYGLLGMSTYLLAWIFPLFCIITSVFHAYTAASDRRALIETLETIMAAQARERARYTVFDPFAHSPEAPRFVDLLADAPAAPRPADVPYDLGPATQGTHVGL